VARVNLPAILLGKEQNCAFLLVTKCPDWMLPEGVESDLLVILGRDIYNVLTHLTQWSEAEKDNALHYASLRGIIVMTYNHLYVDLPRQLAEQN